MSANFVAARGAALAALAAHSPESSDAIEYSSAGKVAVAGDAKNPARVADAVRTLGGAVSGVFLTDENADFSRAENLDGVPVVVCGAASLSGHLGAFTFRLRDGEAESERHADAVLDLRESPLLTRRVPPPGYFHCADDAAAKRAMASLPDLRGVFRKPKYFRYNQSLCAHRKELDGCSRCLSACPAEAIASAGDKIEVDPNLCQGCGACVTTCPGGALRYAHPAARDMLAALRDSGAAFRAASGGAAPLALFHAESDAEKFAAATLDESSPVVPLAVEEVGAVGVEIWLCALAYGFAAVGVFSGGKETRKLAESQAGMANAILSAMNFPRAIRILPDPAGAADFARSFAGSGGLTASAAKFAPDDDKRTMFFTALDFLLQNAKTDEAQKIVDLEFGAPFGEAVVDAGKCTLCMACAGACPASAIRAGGDAPRLLFVEENCLQCGLCESACPEDAVSLRPRLLFSREARRKARTLNEEAPFCCVSCGKPFATARIIARVEEKLRGHWMYQDDTARRRLRLCEDCRAAEMFGGELVRRSDRDNGKGGDNNESEGEGEK